MSILDSIKNTLGNIGSGIQKFFGVTPSGGMDFPVSDETIKKITSGVTIPNEDQLTNFLLESTIRPASRLGARAFGSLGLSSGKTFTPSTKAEEFFFGREPFSQTFGGAGRTVESTIGKASGSILKKLGVQDTKISQLSSFLEPGLNKIAPLIGFGAGLLEASPGGGGKKKVAKEVFETGAEVLAKDLGEEAIGNFKNLNITPEAKKTLEKTVSEIKPVLEEVKGKTLTNQEVIEASQKSDILRKTTSREATLKSEAQLLKTRQHLAKLAEGKDVTKEFLDNLRIVSNEATVRGRELQALSIGADPVLNTAKTKIIKELLDIGKSTEDILRASQGVDFTNAQQLTDFYRKFVKPTLPELIDEYRYINLLSSPKTHIVNTFSNILQAGVLRPATKLVAGVNDFIVSGLTGKSRENYVKEVPKYIQGALSSIGEATSKALNTLRGGRMLERPDLNRIPTGAKILKPFQVIPRLLEASDVFFTTIIKEGEKSALLSKGIPEAKAIEEATRIAEEYTFRKAIDPSNKTGQGKLLSNIDKLTEGIYQLRKVPGVKWFIPFVQTPMNILKQGLEYSPLGLATLPGSTNKAEQIAKAMIGSTVLSGSAYLAFNGNATWGVPTNKDEKEAFYASGRQPYSVKIGDKWVSYSKLGPLAYPIAMASAIQYYMNENPKAVMDSTLKKLTGALTGIAGFFADQSYLQGIGSFVDLARGDSSSLTDIATNIPSQLIPLSSLQRWIANIVDPVFRKTSNEFSVESVVNNLKKGIPGLSASVDPITDLSGEPSQRQFPVLNAVSPLSVTEQTKDEETFQLFQDISRQRALSTKKTQDINDNAKELYQMLKSTSKEEAKTDYLKILKEQPEIAKKIKSLADEDEKQLTSRERVIGNLNITDGSRAKIIIKELDKLASKEEKRALYKRWSEKKIITKKVNEQINEFYGRQ